ncbi:MAG: ArgE/DapE family deacylase [Anaerolineae bacterium]|nr:ArgE/DapE family deacylase [Anaerolineae bacterium]
MPLDHSLITHHLQQMVSVNSINPDLAPGGAGEGEISAWLLELCRDELGLEVRMFEAAPDRHNVVAYWRGNGSGKSLLLTGHTDTVGIENMTGDPFDGRVEGNRLYGRGSYDMKGGLAAVLGAVAALKADGYQPAGDVILGFVCDEEYASIGMDAFVAEEISADAAILVEPTDNDIVIAHKGFAWLTLTTTGRAAHGSLYTEGVDAIAHMGRLLTDLETFEDETLGRKDHPLLGRPSVHASRIKGGLGWSTYPDACELKVEHRLLPDEADADAINLWKKAIARQHKDDPAFHAEVAVDLFRPGYEIRRDAPIVAALHKAVVDKTGAEPLYAGMWAWMDSAVLGSAGIPTVIYGPSGEGAHAAVEYVYLDSVFRCAAIYAGLIRAWCG